MRKTAWKGEKGEYGLETWWCLEDSCHCYTLLKNFFQVRTSSFWWWASGLHSQFFPSFRITILVLDVIKMRLCIRRGKNEGRNKTRVKKSQLGISPGWPSSRSSVCCHLTWGHEKNWAPICITNSFPNGAAESRTAKMCKGCLEVTEKALWKIKFSDASAERYRYWPWSLWGLRKIPSQKEGFVLRNSLLAAHKMKGAMSRVLKLFITPKSVEGENYI